MNALIVAADVASLPVKLIGACLAGLLLGILSGRLRAGDKAVVAAYLTACITATTWLHQMVYVDPGLIAVLLGLLVGFLVFVLAPSRRASLLAAATVTLISLAAIGSVAFLRTPPAQILHAIAQFRRCGGVVQQSDNPGTTYLDEWLVDFEHSGLDDDGLLDLASELPKVPKLWLKLSNCRVGDRGLAALEHAESVSQLDLDGTQVTDAGLVQLKGLTRLQDLRLRGSQVTAEGVKEFQETLPRCKVSWEPPTNNEHLRSAASDQPR